MYVYVYIYLSVYIYTEGERERERKTLCPLNLHICTFLFGKGRIVVSVRGN